jgi:5-methyltetrahydrofolate--homocysteine methyltransferase
MDLIKQIVETLEKGEHAQVAELTTKALEQGVEPKTILDDGLIAGMKVVGDKFKAHEIFLPDVLLAAKAMYAGLDLVKPILASSDVPSKGKVVIGSVQGDLHDIGKNLVGIMLKGAGYDVIDLGNDVSPEKFVETAAVEGALVVGCSALLTTTMTVMKKVSEQLSERGLKDKVKLIIGGAPLSAGFAEEIGADAYGYDAVKAVELVDGFAAGA